MLLSSKKVTIDISSTSIKMLMVKGNKVDRWASAPLEAGLIENGIIAHPVYLGNMIKNLMQTSGMRTKKIIASINGIYSVSRIVRLPIRNGHTHEQVLNDKAAEVLPPSTENFYISWKMLSKSAKGDEALLIGMQPSVVDPEILALKSAGIKPYIMNLKGMTLLKLLNEPDALIANVESASVDIVLVAQGLPYVMRTVTRREGISTADWAKDIAVLLEQTLMFYNMSYRLNRTDYDMKLYLSGEMAENEIVSSIIRDSCDYPIGTYNIPFDCPPNLPVCQYAINLGLALKQSYTPIPVQNQEQITAEAQSE